MAERRLKGRSASPGLAIGPLLRIDHVETGNLRQQGTPLEEVAALRAAMAEAGSDLEALSEAASGDGADILSFQIEMLTDPALIEEALIDIEAGMGSTEAWKKALDGQIEGYEAGEDDYFRARASDLRDLEDRVGRKLMGLFDQAPDLADNTILVDLDLTPSRFLALDHNKLGGIALSQGSVNGHVAILARARGISMLVNLDETLETVGAEDGLAIIDTETKQLILAPTAATQQTYQEKLTLIAEKARGAAEARHHPAITRDGQCVDVLINVDDPQAIDDDTLRAADGIGLLRTEFLFIGRADLPDEDEQCRTYTDLVDRLAGRPAIIRTLDIGGDKPLPALPQAAEANPFLGLRGIRFCLAHVTLFRTQARALLRAKPGRELKVMLPMVSTQGEIDQTKALFQTCLEELLAEGQPAEMPPIGIMIETPAAAIAIDQLEAAFYSIGSNDLIQYVMAAARDASGQVANLLDPTHPAIGRLIGQVAAYGHASGKEVSLCGDMASDPALLPLLLQAGLRKISVAPAALDRIKVEIVNLDLSKASTTQP